MKPFRALFVLCLSLLLPVRAAETREIRLDGLRVRLGQPVEVTKQIGWRMDWKHHTEDPEWSFIHLTPYLAKFPHGNLVATYAMDPDAHDTPMTISGFQISKDGGAHWGRRYSVLMTHIPMIFIPKPPDSLMAISAEMTPQTAGDERNFTGPAYIFEHGGARMTLVPDGVRIVDWPWPIVPGARNAGPQPSDNWPTQLRITGSVIQEDGRLLITAYGFMKGDPRDDTMLLSSEDGGTTWRYFSTIAGPHSRFASEMDFPSANEITVIRLAEGDLMAVFRVEGGPDRHLHRAYSRDGGRTWSKPDALPAASVEPQVVRTAGGTIALSTGRPGLDLWLSTDPRARRWQKVDIAAYHNAWFPEADLRIGTFPRRLRDGTVRTAWQTTAYTGLVETAPNRLLLCYDRDPEQAPADPSDLSRVYVLPVELVRE